MRSSRLMQRGESPARRGNSMARVGRVSPRPRFSTRDVTEGLSETLRGRYSHLRSPAKEMARETGFSERECRSLLNGEHAMQLHKLFNAANVPEIQEWAARMLGLQVADPVAFNREMAKGIGGTLTIRVEGNGLKIETGEGT